MHGFLPRPQLRDGGRSLSCSPWRPQFPAWCSESPLPSAAGGAERLHSERTFLMSRFSFLATAPSPCAPSSPSPKNSGKRWRLVLPWKEKLIKTRSKIPTEHKTFCGDRVCYLDCGDSFRDVESKLIRWYTSQMCT